MPSHFKTIAYTDASPVVSRSLCRGDSWTNGDMHAIRHLPHQLFEGVCAWTFLHSNRLSSCCRRGNYPHSTEPVPVRPKKMINLFGRDITVFFSVCRFFSTVMLALFPIICRTMIGTFGGINEEALHPLQRRFQRLRCRQLSIGHQFKMHQSIIQHR